MTLQTLAEFQARARDPSSWQRTARELAIAGNYLIDWYDTGPPQMADAAVSMQGETLPMMVLYAAAAENLLKAILVAQGHDPVPAGKLHGDFTHHDLPSYAAKAGLALGTDADTLMTQLKDLMLSGKYPVAKGPGQNPTAWQLKYPADVQRVWSLLETLEGVLIGTGRPCLPKWNFRVRYRPPGYSDREQ